MTSHLIALDLMELLDEIEAPAARETFTLDILSAEEMDRAWTWWTRANGRFGSWRLFHQWRINDLASSPLASGHECMTVQAYLGCASFPFAHADRVTCSCVGGDVHRTVCAPCDWASDVVTTESAAVQAWHDHAWPGWRDLPVVDGQGTRPTATWAKRLESVYPDGWGKPGAPVLTRRSHRMSRDVPRRSPWGGWDMAAPELPE